MIDVIDARTFDVRKLSSRERAPKVLNLFDVLPKGESFIVVNDEDGRPLHLELQATKSGQFRWEYLEQGPEVWKVKISRIENPADGDGDDSGGCCGMCGGR